MPSTLSPGSPDPSFLIFLNGIEYRVGRNLIEALQYLRHKTETRFWWIDASCINQQDNDEKGAQVAMMKEIYHTASEVIVWLGPHGDESDQFMRCMSKNQAIRQLMKNPIKNQKDISMRTGMYKSGRSVARDLFSRPYWTVAKVVRVACGDEIVPWDDFIDFSLWKPGNGLDEPLLPSEKAKVDGSNERLARNATRTRRIRDSHTSRWSLDEIVPRRMLNEIRASWNLQTRTKESLMTGSKWDLPPASTIASLIDLSFDSEATNQRDKIFALLGLVRQGAGKYIEPDYNLSLCTIYCLAVRAMYCDLFQRPKQDGESICDGKEESVEWYFGMGGLYHAVIYTISMCFHNPLNLDETGREDCDGIKRGSHELCFQNMRCLAMDFEVDRDLQVTKLGLFRLRSEPTQWIDGKTWRTFANRSEEQGPLKDGLKVAII